jgi:dihydroflavonol-4-reductase
MSSSSSSKQSVLVTGASGFIGSHLVRRLLQLQHDVHVLARPSSDLSALPAGYTRHVGDVTDAESILNACKQTSFDVIFHLAAHIGYTKAERSSMQRINVDGTRNILNAVKQCDVRRLIYCSSVVAVGACETEPSDAELLNEDSEYNMTKYNLGYFETKREAELLALQFAKDQNIDVGSSFLVDCCKKKFVY